MPDLIDGESAEIKGSAATPYTIKNVGGVYSCTCPAWRNQSVGIERRTCKHIRKYRGEAAEEVRIGSALPTQVAKAAGEESSAPELLLAQSWTNDVDLAGWWMSEKLDGVRAYWDGQQFLSRQGNLFYAPDWFLEQLPSTPLDGELWLNRKSFQRTVSIVRRQDKSDLWRELAFVVFDAPAVTDVFERRQKAVEEFLANRDQKIVRRLEQQICRDVDQLRQELARVEALGGEGLMLRQPESQYEAGRSSTLLKVKSFHDGEARVIEQLPGAGRHKGRLGAVLVELPNGKQFSVGTGFTDAQRESPPPIGSSITFRYQELTDGGVPRFPSFVRLRRDVAETTSKPQARGSGSTSESAATVTSSNTSSKDSTMPRNFECSEGSSSKFWEVSVSGTDVTVRYGRIGTDGQTQTKSFGDVAAAQKHADKLVAQKVKKGYQEVVAR